MSGLVVRPARESDADTMAATEIAVLRPCRRLRECSGMTPEPTVQDETANNSDDSPADGIQGDHADQQECEHHHGGAALTVAVSLCDHNSDNADQKCNGEEHSARLGEPKPVTEPSPIASESRHGESLGQRNERHLGPAFGNVTRGD